ncbi:hypothetical protein ANN_14478 [Periplaneta americana]|uniref:Histone-lysine N-methyltransferase SETMAR n=1 Tax=Periplaneta americana TaxID=6978 RepID=A0ABQ8SX22_PERAM|nr:hypothetical protein ANN_14478 [Periplaneta americana]
MAGLCEGGNEPPSALKAISNKFAYAIPQRQNSARSMRTATRPSKAAVPKTARLQDAGEGRYAPHRHVLALSPQEASPQEAGALRLRGRHLLHIGVQLGDRQQDRAKVKIEFTVRKIYDVSIICQPDRSRLVSVAWQQWSEMEALIPSPAACEVRSVIKFFNAQSIAPIDIHRQLCQVYGPNIMSKQMVGAENLTPEHKMQRLGAALTFLQRYHDDGDEFLDRIVTGDESWISHFTPETKQQSMHWRHSGSPVRTKFKHTLSVRKVMCTVFWDRKGILLIDFLPRGETVNADRYCETLRKLRRAIQNKRCGMLTAGVVLLHDNARPHTARRTTAVLTEFCWELLDHPPYSPDLTPSDLHVFLHLKKFLSSGERFGNDEELKISVTRWFHSQAAEFYDRGIQKLIPRCDKCLNSDGGYVEK